MKLGQLVGHKLNDKARGIVLTIGESSKGKAFAIVDWLIDPNTKKAEAKRHSPEELIAL